MGDIFGQESPNLMIPTIQYTTVLLKSCPSICLHSFANLAANVCIYQHDTSAHFVQVCFYKSLHALFVLLKVLV